MQGGYFLIPRKFEAAGRYSLVDFDNQRSDKDAEREITAGLNWFFAGHNKKVQFNWIRIDNEKARSVSSTNRSDDIDYFYRLQYQMAF